MASVIRNFTLRNALAFVALFVVLGGSATAATKLINGKNIKKGTITSKQVRNGSLLAKDFKAGQLVAGAPGAQGARGLTGEAGPNGSTGAKGETGAAGTNGTAGIAGDAGADGDTGADGQDGTNGLDGDDGADGAAGAPGAAGNSLNLVKDSGGTLGPLVAAEEGVAAHFDFDDPSASTPYRPASFMYLNADAQLVRVTGDGAYAFPKERVVVYENYQAGSPASCTGRVFVEPQPVSLPGQLFRLGTTDAQAYVWGGVQQSVPTQGIDGGQGCEQLNSPSFSGFQVTKLGTPAPLNSAVHIAAG